MSQKDMPDPGYCACGRRGDWLRPMYGHSGDKPVYWPTCPTHRSSTTGNPIPKHEYARVDEEAAAEVMEDGR